MERFASFFLGVYLILFSFVVNALEYVPGEVIVRFKSKSTNSSSFLGKASNKSLILKRSWQGLNLHHFQIKSEEAVGVGAKIDQLLQDPDVLYAEPNYILKKASLPDEEIKPLSIEEVQAVVESQSFSMTSAHIQAAESWGQLSSNGSPIIVAVIDTGVDYTHSVFTQSDAIWSNSDEIAGNGIDDDHNGYVDDIRGWNFVSNSNNPLDDDGHGTHVSGTVIGVSQNILTSPLGASKIKIMPLKFLDSSGSGTTSAAIQAIYYAIQNGAKVLNNSWGGGSYSAALHEAIAYSYQSNTVFVAASGNAGSNNDLYPMYPANYDVPNVLSIAASTDSDQLAYFSNFGKTSVHLGSPGVSILSTLPSDSFGYSSGTSMATPFVSGVAALMIYEMPLMSAYQVKTIILGTGDNSSGLSDKVSTNSRLSVLNAILMAKGASLSSSQPDYTIGLSGSDRELASTLTTNGSGGCGLVQVIGGNRGKIPFKTGLIFLILFSIPLLIVIWLRNREIHSRRQFERFKIDTSVTLKLGERELVGSVSSISLGGVQLNTQALLEEGGVVQMLIRSPDGKEQIQVEGRIVWQENQKSYGVQFLEDSKAGSLQKIAIWTRSLMKV